MVLGSKPWSWVQIHLIELQCRAGCELPNEQQPDACARMGPDINHQNMGQVYKL